MEEPEKGSSGDELGDDGEVGGRRACAHEEHNVGVLQPFHYTHLRPELL